MITSWLGKILGLILGYWLLGFFGAILGLIIGHSFDVSLRQRRIKAAFSNNAEVQQIFFKALFSTMGHLSKIDGRVTADEISAARLVMSQMQLNDQQKRQAIDLFNHGKAPGFDLYGHLNALKTSCRGHKSLLRMFMQFQFKAAYADGQLKDSEYRTLRVIAETLGFSKFEFDRMKTLYKAQASFESKRQSYQSGQTHTNWTPQSKLRQAYKALGVSSSAPYEEVKKAYRSLINQYHPDKLVAKGLPEEMMKAATEKTQEIKAAYETIRQAKGWR